MFSVCRESFLSLWSCANPRGKTTGKELADILVVCDPDIVLVSVKEIGLSITADPAVQRQRWWKKAIEQSADQLYGADRILRGSKNVVLADGTEGLAIPPPDRLRVHRIAVALGSEGKVPLKFGDFGKGFVHVLDERSFTVLLRELDTITDLTTYLTRKEQFLGKTSPIFEREEDLLAFYLKYQRSFPEADVIILDSDLWTTFSSGADYRKRRELDQASYMWDRLIETISIDLQVDKFGFGSGVRDAEIGLRVMAREDRFSRRILGKQFRKFLDRTETIRARMMPAPSGIVYVLLACPHDTGRQIRTDELQLRCFVARGLFPKAQTVIGIATERHERGKGYSLDLTCLHQATWTTEDQERMEGIQKDLGYFVNPTQTTAHEDEYPTTKE